MRPYLVWTFAYRPDSSGQKVMHRLCHELNRAGQTAYVAFERRNPAWDTPYHPAPLEGDWIAVYPEIVAGNPWDAPRVARYVLNDPGKLGGDTAYAPSELVFAYHELFNDMGVPADRILYLPAIELDIYTDRQEPRSGTAFYVGKGKRTRALPGSIEITRDLRRDQRRLADTLNRAALLYCFDNLTAMIRIALLCGCPVMLIPDGVITDRQRDMVIGPGVGWDEVPAPFDSDAIRADELAALAAFRGQLASFVKVTQA